MSSGQQASTGTAAAHTTRYESTATAAAAKDTPTAADNAASGDNNLGEGHHG